MLNRITRLASALLLALAGTVAVAADIENYRLTERALSQYERATEAMYQFALENPELAERMGDDDEESEEDGNADIATMAKRLDERAPGVRKAMEKSGMKLEEYFTFSFVLAANAFGAAMAEQFGGGDESQLTPLQRDNINFIRTHGPRIEAFGARMQEKYGALMEDEEDEYSDEEYYEDDEYSDEGY